MPRLLILFALFSLSCNHQRMEARREWKEELDRTRNRELYEWDRQHHVWIWRF